MSGHVTCHWKISDNNAEVEDRYVAVEKLGSDFGLLPQNVTSLVKIIVRNLFGSSPLLFENVLTI